MKQITAFISERGFALKTLSVRRFFPMLSLAFILIACRDPVIPASYRLVLPTLPPAWEEILGPPWWRVEWFDSDGRLHSCEGTDAALPGVNLPADWASPVLAYPFWPGHGLAPGYMRPAGAIAPFDVEGSELRLTWEAGPEAWFYRALASALAAASSDGGISEAAAKRRPDRFDWPRFRNLLRGGNVPPEIQRDPWLVSWDAAAAKTVRSGFDRRCIQASPREPLTVSVPWPGPWVGSSPFAEVRHWEAGETVMVEAAAEPDTLVSSRGMLRYTVNGTIRIPWKEQDR
jgi:hypothetical protein